MPCLSGREPIPRIACRRRGNCSFSLGVYESLTMQTKTKEILIYHCQACGNVALRPAAAMTPLCCGQPMARAASENGPETAEKSGMQREPAFSGVAPRKPR